MTIDPYQELGVKHGASADDIRKAFRRLAKKHHPDKNGGSKASEERFKRLSVAFDIVGDAERRRDYDAANPARPAFAEGPGFRPAHAYGPRPFRPFNPRKRRQSEARKESAITRLLRSPLQFKIGLILIIVGLTLLALAIPTSHEPRIRSATALNHLTRAVWFGVLSLFSGGFLCVKTTSENF